MRKLVIFFKNETLRIFLLINTLEKVTQMIKAGDDLLSTKFV